MNERIRELAEQAWDSLIDEVGDVVDENGRLNWTFLHSYDKRFAELIVKECINEIHVADVGDLKAKGYYLDKVAEHIEKHFGVEE